MLVVTVYSALEGGAKKLEAIVKQVWRVLNRERINLCVF